MNIVQLHEKVRYWLDHVGSARYDAEDIDQALNTAINQIWKEKYDRTKPNHQSESFESTQAVRDEMSEFVKKIDSNDFTMTNNSGDVTITDLPDNYRYMLSIELLVGTTRYPVFPQARNNKSRNRINPYRRVTGNAFNRCYFEENAEGIKIYHPFDIAAPTNVEIEYLKKPDEVYFGIEKDENDSIGVGVSCIALITPTRFNGTDYNFGDMFNSGGSPVFEYGSVTIDFTNPELNSALHEELALRAAINSMKVTNQKEKVALLVGELASL